MLFPSQGLNLVLVGIEDALFATPKVSMDLSGKKSIFGYICMSGIFIERQQKKPDHPDDDACG